MEKNYNKIYKYFKGEAKLIKLREIILSNIHLLEEEFSNSRLIGILGINNKSQNLIIY